MADHESTRCPACDVANAAHASFCQQCGHSMGSGSAAPPSQMYTGAIGVSESSRIKGYVVAFIAVAAVLVVGGALVLLAGTDGDEGSAADADSAPISDVDPAGETSVGITQAPSLPSTAVTVTEPPITEPAITEPLVTDPLVTDPLVTDPPVTAPPTTPPPATAAPTTAPPTTAPPTTAPPAPSVALSFDQAANFYRGYIATAINGDYNAAWNMLSSSDQADYPRGFDQFVGFWRSVSFADVERVEPVGGSAGFQSLVVDMAYGQVDGDPTSFEVVEVDVNVRPDGSFQIFDYRYIRNQ